jgi:hypothetical protein
MGRRPDGTWDLWFGTQNITYRRIELPGQMLVCADGDGANLRREWGTESDPIAVLPDHTAVTAESFVLTEPGSVHALRPGTGWYRIGTEQHGERGWVFSTLLSDARLGDCALRDADVRADARAPVPQAGTVALPGVAAVTRAVETRDADALAALVRYTGVPCITTPQGGGAPPLCSAAGVPVDSPVETLPALLCEGEYFLRAVVPQFFRQQLERGGFVPYGVLRTDTAPYTFPLEVPAAGEWSAPEYAIIFHATESGLDLGFYLAGGEIVALRSFSVSGEFVICGPTLPPASHPAWLVPPRAP